jgi:hypothetical protein
MLWVLLLLQLLLAAAMQGPSNVAGQNSAAPQQQQQQQQQDAHDSNSCAADDDSRLFAPQLQEFIAKQLTPQAEGEQTLPAGFVQGLSAVLVTQAQQACNSSSSSLSTPMASSSSSSSSNTSEVLWYVDAQAVLKGHQVLNLFVHEVMQRCEQFFKVMGSTDDAIAACKQPVLGVLKAAGAAVEHLQQQQQLSDTMLQALIVFVKLAIGYCLNHAVFEISHDAGGLTEGADSWRKMATVAAIVGPVQRILFSSTSTMGHLGEASPGVSPSAGISSDGSITAVAAAAQRLENAMRKRITNTSSSSSRSGSQPAAAAGSKDSSNIAGAAAAAASEAEEEGVALATAAEPAVCADPVWILSKVKLLNAITSCAQKFLSKSAMETHRTVGGCCSCFCRVCFQRRVSQAATALLLHTDMLRWPMSCSATVGDLLPQQCIPASATVVPAAHTHGCRFASCH